MPLSSSAATNGVEHRQQLSSVVHCSELTPSSSTAAASSSSPLNGGCSSIGAAVAGEVDRQQQNGGLERKRQAKDRFRYGNYNRYYGVRNQGFDHDPRVDLLPAQWFCGRRVLDIGCNAGHLTLEIAKKMGPSHILGIDIDDHLVGVARKNIRHYCDATQKLVGKFPASLMTSTDKHSTTITTTANNNGREEPGNKCATTGGVDKTNGEMVPSSSSSPCSATTTTNGGETANGVAAHLPYEQFPKNVWFLRENYVLECDEFLEMVREEYDVILALSITKWVHLNWGDCGLKRFLRRTFLNLRPGGRLLLEAQPYPSYYKKAKMTPDMFETYKAIQFKPHQFKDFLLSDSVGFSECEELGTPTAVSKGFERPILVFKKSSAARKRKKDQKSKNPSKSSRSATTE